MDVRDGALSAAAKDIGGIVNIGDELERVGKKDDMNSLRFMTSLRIKTMVMFICSRKH
ncbi:MAG: hypothetical protein ACLTVV_08410 [Ruminococcus sp.]